MWLYITALAFLLALVGAVVYWARKSAKDSARLVALKRELKEKERAQTIVSSVRHSSIDSVRDKLKQTK